MKRASPPSTTTSFYGSSATSTVAVVKPATADIAASPPSPSGVNSPAFEPLNEAENDGPAVTLREKRKDLMYQSPLNSVAMDDTVEKTTTSSSAAYRYAYTNLKIKKKEVVEN